MSGTKQRMGMQENLYLSYGSRRRNNANCCTTNTTLHIHLDIRYTLPSFSVRHTSSSSFHAELPAPGLALEDERVVVHHVPHNRPPVHGPCPAAVRLRLCRPLRHPPAVPPPPTHALVLSSASVPPACSPAKNRSLPSHSFSTHSRPSCSATGRSCSSRSSLDPRAFARASSRCCRLAPIQAARPRAAAVARLARPRYASV